MFKIAVTGANSFIGTHLLNYLNLDELSINALSRKPMQHNIQQKNVTFYSGDLLNSSTLDDFTKGCSVVVNLAYLWDENCSQNLKAIENLAEACVRNKVRRLVHCSTSSVYGSVQANIVDEGTECLPQTDYAKTKYAIEEFLLNNYERKLELAILRPTQVFGPNGKNLLKLAHDLLNRPRVLNYLKSSLLSKRKMNLVAVENVIEALSFLIKQDFLQKQIYLISDDEVNENQFHQVESYLIKNIPAKSYILPVVSLPLFFYKSIYKMFGKGYVNPKTAYLGQNLLNEGFVKTKKFNQSLSEFVAWYRINKL